MTASDLKSLLDRVQSWPEAAQDELVSVAMEIETELKARDYVASQEDLRIIDAAMASIDAGDLASEAEVKAVFAKFRGA
jgi:hypothetical protein